MSAKVIDGTAIAAQIESEIALGVVEFVKKVGRGPCLAVIMLGDDAASKIYVSRKQEACKRVGIRSFLPTWPIGNDLRAGLQQLASDSGVDGILLQLPLPPEYGDCRDYFSHISAAKDVDVFNPENLGLLVQGKPRFEPCTPQAIQQMLVRYGITIAGKHIVVVNRSCVVGRPLSSQLLIQEDQLYANATVTVCHDATTASMLKDICLTADIVIVAVGIPGFLTADMVKEGVVIVDVGINRVNGKVVGDVHESVWKKAGFVSKVPGGCGPVTISFLMKNTLLAAKLSFGL